jgi:molybdate transport system substrate-binding protein
MVSAQAVRKPITGISSMATRQVLAELAATYERLSGQSVVI